MKIISSFFRAHLILSSLFFSSLFISPTLHAVTTQETAQDPLLVIVLMVKNEEAVIVPTLEPFVQGGVDAFYIFDTGSTDQTVEVVTDYLQSCGVRFAVGQEPFIDFAASRNRGLDLAQEAFPNCAFMCMPDAEWYIQNAQDLVKFCKEHLNDSEPGYSIRIASTDLDFRTPRLMRRSAHLRFVGKVHEVLSDACLTQVPGHVMFELRPSRFGADKSRKRWERDVEILLQGYVENPFDTRNLFYLAQTYWCLGDHENAYKFYHIRAPMTGWDEEDFLSWYRLGRITEDLARMQKTPDLYIPFFSSLSSYFNTAAETMFDTISERSEIQDGKQVQEENIQDNATSEPQYNRVYSWNEALGYYIKAFTMRPCRAEPLVRIAWHYLNQDNHAMGYVFALRACQIPYPNDILMVEKELYEYERWEVLSRCAWYIGEYEVGFAAACKAKQARPDLTHIVRNARIFFDKLCEPNSNLNKLLS